VEHVLVDDHRAGPGERHEAVHRLRHRRRLLDDVDEQELDRSVGGIARRERTHVHVDEVADVGDGRLPARKDVLAVADAEARPRLLHEQVIGVDAWRRPVWAATEEARPEGDRRAAEEGPELDHAAPALDDVTCQAVQEHHLLGSEHRGEAACAGERLVVGRPVARPRHRRPDGRQASLQFGGVEGRGDHASTRGAADRPGLASACRRALRTSRAIDALPGASASARRNASNASRLRPSRRMA